MENGPLGVDLPIRKRWLSISFCMFTRGYTSYPMVASPKSPKSSKSWINHNLKCWKPWWWRNCGEFGHGDWKNFRKERGTQTSTRNSISWARGNVLHALGKHPRKQRRMLPIICWKFWQLNQMRTDCYGGQNRNIRPCPMENASVATWRFLEMGVPQ